MGNYPYPGAELKSVPVVLQAGQLVKNNGEWELIAGDLDSKDANGNALTALNGPKESNEQYVNKTGFIIVNLLMKLLEHQRVVVIPKCGCLVSVCLKPI